MRYIYIDKYVLDEKYWEYEVGTGYYSNHVYRNSPYESSDTCANCNGALCDGCKFIMVKGNFICSIPSDELCNMIIKEGAPKEIAEELAFCADMCLDKIKDYILVYPTDYTIKKSHNDFYQKLITIDDEIMKLIPVLTTDLNYKIETFADVEDAISKELKDVDERHLYNQLCMFWDSKGSLKEMMDYIKNPN